LNGLKKKTGNMTANSKKANPAARFLKKEGLPTRQKKKKHAGKKKKKWKSCQLLTERAFGGTLKEDNKSTM